MNPSSSALVPSLLVDALSRPVTVLVGHFGSGKTEIAVNLAFALRAHHRSVTLVDLDVVKPYFRSRVVIDELEARQIVLVAPSDDRFFADLPIVVPEVRAAVGQAAVGLRRVVVDAGGADVGARVLGSIPGLLDPAVTDTLFVVNGRRPFAETPAAVAQMIAEVQAASRLRPTGLVANTHLMEETTLEVVEEGVRLARDVSARTGIPVLGCAVGAALADEAATRGVCDGLPLLVIDRHIMPPLDLRARRAQRRGVI